MSHFESPGVWLEDKLRDLVTMGFDFEDLIEVSVMSDMLMLSMAQGDTTRIPLRARIETDASLTDLLRMLLEDPSFSPPMGDLLSLAIRIAACLRAKVVTPTPELLSTIETWFSNIELDGEQQDDRMPRAILTTLRREIGIM